MRLFFGCPKSLRNAALRRSLNFVSRAHVMYVGMLRSEESAPVASHAAMRLAGAMISSQHEGVPMRNRNASLDFGTFEQELSDVHVFVGEPGSDGFFRELMYSPTLLVSQLDALLWCFAVAVLSLVGARPLSCHSLPGEGIFARTSPSCSS